MFRTDFIFIVSSNKNNSMLNRPLPYSKHKMHDFLKVKIHITWLIKNSLLYICTITFLRQNNSAETHNHLKHSFDETDRLLVLVNYLWNGKDFFGDILQIWKFINFTKIICLKKKQGNEFNLMNIFFSVLITIRIPQIILLLWNW